MTQPLRLAAAPGHPAWPMTADALDALDRELDLLHAETLRPLEPIDPDGVVVALPVRHSRDRYEALRRVRAGAFIAEDPQVAAIGRRVELADESGDVFEIALVLPGDGEPANGWVSGDAPLGAAVLGARAGETVVVRAPSGPWTALVRAVR